MKQLTKIIVAAGLIITLFTLACNKSNRPETLPDNISSAVILAWNEVAYDAMGGATNQHSLFGSRIYAIVHAAMHDVAVNQNGIHLLSLAKAPRRKQIFEKELAS